MAGQPPMFKSQKDLEWISDWTIGIKWDSIKNDDFNKEKDIEEYIVSNIELFTKSILNDKVVSYEVNKPISYQYFWPRWRRIDLYIQWEKCIYIIELKNPSSWTESRAAIWQILDYWREFLETKKELIIITTHFDSNTAKTIKYYNLPIRYIYIDKKRSLEFINFTENE